MLDQEQAKRYAEDLNKFLAQRAVLDKQIEALRVLTGIAPTKTEPNGEGLSAMVRKALASFPDALSFSVRDVVAFIQNNIAPNADERRTEIGSVLFKIAQAEGFHVVEPGAGRKATIYRKKK